MMKNRFAKRHYEMTAKTLAEIRKEQPDIWPEQWDKIVTKFVAMFKADNIQFKPDYFREYVKKHQEL